jgi:hypothetical protein
MANPTAYYSWEFPLAGDDPWYDKLDRFISNIDLSVRSLELLLRALYQTTVVWSLAPGKSPALSAFDPLINLREDGDLRFFNAVFVTSDALQPAASSSFVVSLSPIGPLIGQFTVPSSGVKVRLRMLAPAFGIQFMSGDPTGILLPDCTAIASGGGVVVNYRLVDGTQVNTLNMIGDSLWKHEYKLGGDFDYPVFTAVLSLQPGTYTVELQARAHFYPNSATWGTYWHGGEWALYATTEI